MEKGTEGSWCCAKKNVCLDFHKKGTLIINFHVSPFSQSATQCNENWIEFDLQIKCFDSLERILVLNQVSTKTNWDFIKSPPYFAASEMNISTWKGPVCFDLLFRVCNKHITNTQCKKIITIHDSRYDLVIYLTFWYNRCIQSTLKCRINVQGQIAVQDGKEIKNW